jgi:hypothetical protein
MPREIRTVDPARSESLGGDAFVGQKRDRMVNIKPAQDKNPRFADKIGQNFNAVRESPSPWRQSDWR